MRHSTLASLTKPYRITVKRKFMKKYQVYKNRNVEFTKVAEVAEFDTLEEAKVYCSNGTQGYVPVCDGDNNYEGRGNNFRYEVYDGEPVIIDENGYVVGMKESVYETDWYYC